MASLSDAWASSSSCSLHVTHRPLSSSFFMVYLENARTHPDNTGYRHQCLQPYSATTITATTTTTAATRATTSNCNGTYSLTKGISCDVVETLLLRWRHCPVAPLRNNNDDHFPYRCCCDACACCHHECHHSDFRRLGHCLESDRMNLFHRSPKPIFPFGHSVVAA